MVGPLQWLITLGRFDIHPHVVSLSRFRAAPRQGQFENSRGYMPLSLAPRIMLSGFELKNLTIPTCQSRIMTGHTLFMVMLKKLYLMISLNPLVNL